MESSAGSTGADKQGFLGRARDLWGLASFADAPAKRAFRQAVGLNILAAGAEIGSLLLVQQAALSLVEGSNPTTIPMVQLALIGAMLGSALLRLVGQRAIIKTQFAVTTSLTIQAFTRLQNQDYSSYLNSGASRAFATFEELQQACYNALMPMISGIVSLATAALIVAVISGLYPLMGLAILVVTTIGLLIASRMRKRSGAFDMDPLITRQRARLMLESRTAFRDICLTNGQQRIVADFEQTERAFRARLAQTAMAGQTARSEIEIAGFSIFLIAALAWPLFDADTRSLVPALGVLALGGLRLLPHLAIIRSAANQIAAHGQVTSAMRQLLADSLPRNLAATTAPLRFDHSIILTDIRVSRPDRADTLRGLHLVIPHGTRIGIVGASGSGKSTLLDVLCGLITPVEGELQVDGETITPDNAAAWRDRMGVVSQNALLVGDSLREAICYPVLPQDADEARLSAALALTGLDQFAVSLQEGLDTSLGEALTRLSGGQRQRLALAHALYRAQDLLVLDEATSQLDQESELVIRSCVDQLPRDLTIVLVTHRPALLDCCDVVYRLEDGQLRPWQTDRNP